LDIRNNFTDRVVRHWHRLPREVASALEMFKVRLDEALNNLV
ncbi:hypothetical protein N326_11585, partial [Eurypyga helias]